MFRSAEADFEAASLENTLALVYLALGSLDVARAHAAQARAYFSNRDDERWLAHVTETDGQIALAAGLAPDAMALSTESLRLAEASGDRKVEISALLLRARSQRALGDLNGAAATLDRAASLGEEHGRRAQLQTVLGEWSDVTAALGDLAQALALARRALDAGRR